MQARFLFLWVRGFFSECRTRWFWMRERAQSFVAGTRELLGIASWLMAAGNPSKYRRCSAGSSIWLQTAQKAKWTSRSLWLLPKLWQTVNFGVWWRSFPLWMTRKPKLLFYWFTNCWMSNFFSSLNTRFGSGCQPSPGRFSCLFGANILQLPREFRCSFVLGFLRSWRKRTRSFLPRSGRSRVLPVSWNFFTIFHTAEQFISSRFVMSTLFFHFCKA